MTPDMDSLIQFSYPGVGDFSYTPPRDLMTVLTRRFTPQGVAEFKRDSTLQITKFLLFWTICWAGIVRGGDEEKIKTLFARLEKMDRFLHEQLRELFPQDAPVTEQDIDDFLKDLFKKDSP